MAIKKIALPEGTTLDINDARVVSDAIAYVGDSEGTATYVDGGQVIDVTTKADKVTNATNGNFAGLDANGNLVDSGHKHSDYLTSFTETDPVFAASAAHGISSSDISGWNSKLTGVTFNNVAATVTGGVAAITASIPSAPGTLNTNNTSAQTTSSSEALSGSINLHKVAKTGTYSDLIGAPNITISTSEPASSQGSNGDIWIVV